MPIVARRIAELLQGDGPFHPAARHARPWWWLPAFVVVFSPIYGAVMGSFHFNSPERTWQCVFAALKLPLLLFGTTALCMPGFFVLNTVMGLRDDFRAALQAIFAGQSGLSIALASLAPLTRVWYFSEGSYRAALLFNAGMLALATLAGHIVTFRYYRPLVRRDGKHLWMAYAWLVLYAFVGIQMGWMLRPFVGDPTLPVAFFRGEPFSNAYVVVFRLIVR